MSTLRNAATQALEAIDKALPHAPHHSAFDVLADYADDLRAALAKNEATMPITDDHGRPLLPQYRVIEQHGNWRLLYDQHQSGEAVRHEFRIQKLRHDIALYPGITLTEAQKRFRERVEADNE